MMTAPSSIPPGLVWLASYPKSGNTWTRILLSNLLFSGDHPQNINQLTEREGAACDRSAFDDLTMVDSSLLSEDECDRFRPAVYHCFAAERTTLTCIKSHDAYTRLGDGTPVMGRAARAAVYVVRDPRDVAVSFAHHLGCDTDTAVKFLNNSTHSFRGGPLQLRQRLNGWSGHAQSWLDQIDVPVHLVRYEDLLDNTARTFGKLVDFLGIDASENDIGRAVRHASFDELQRQEQEFGFAEKPACSARFFREGRAGGWRDHLSTTLIRSIEAVHGEMMDRLGYQRERIA